MDGGERRTDMRRRRVVVEADEGDIARDRKVAFFRRAQETSRKGAEQGKEMLRSRL